MQKACSTKSVVGFEPKRLPFAYSAVTIAVLLVTGCATQSQSGANQSTNHGNGISSSTQLREVYVPGSVHNVVYGNPNIRLDPMLNPRTQAPSFKEDGNLTTACSPNTRLMLVDDRGVALVDEPRFQQLMARRMEIAQARHIWRFEVARNEAQLKKVSGPRTAGRTDRRAAPRNTPVRPDVMIRDLMNGWLKPNNGRSRPGMASADEINSRLPNFPKMQEDLAYNAHVLAQQDETLKDQEREYTDQLMALYQDVFSRFSKTPASQISLATLNLFDSFRFRNIFTCTLRGEAMEQAKALNQSISYRYDPMAKSIIESSRSLILEAIKGAKSTSDLQGIYQKELSTDFLRDIAAQDKTLAQGLQQRTTVLLAQEAREREEARKRAEAEAARQAMLLKKKYLQNAANNVAPSGDEVLRLVSAYVMEKTELKRDYGRLERTSQAAFHYFSKVAPIFGELLLGEFTSGISGLSCKPENNRQRCSFTEIRTYTDYNLGFITTEMAGDYSGQTREAEFYWDATGLQSPTLKKQLAGAGSSTVSRSRGYSSPSNSGSSDDMADLYRDHEEDARERDRQREEQQQWQRQQDQMRRQSGGRCGPSPYICNY